MRMVKTPRVRRHIADRRAGSIRREGGNGFDFRIFRKRLHPPGIKDTAGGVRFEIPQLGTFEAIGDIAGVAHEQRRAVDDHLAIHLPTPPAIPPAPRLESESATPSCKVLALPWVAR